MSMFSNALITGGSFHQNVDQRQVYTQTRKSARDRLQEAVAPAAFHNSGDRFDPPKCHPNTRVAVRDKIDKWARLQDVETLFNPVLWLSGPAGAGKSAIAQTLAEDFHSQGLLAGSFFFGRSDPSRNHARSLIATIVYQLSAIVPAADQVHLWSTIDRDPLVFTKSLIAQFEALVVIPFRHLLKTMLWTLCGLPYVIIIDGLDECLDHGMQRDVLLMLCASVNRFHLPFRFLLVSRPEHDIQTVFASPDFNFIHTRLFLDDTYLPDDDIELFLRDQFEECRATHPFRSFLPAGWPSDDVIWTLVRKSSGQFIYASVVVKYFKSTRHRPDHRLDVVLSLRPARKDLPFSELDALYTQILSEVQEVDIILDVLSFLYCQTSGDGINMEATELILGLDPGYILILFCDLSSLVHIIPRVDGTTMKIWHASLLDYLEDQARSGAYYMYAIEPRVSRIAKCLTFLSTSSNLKFEGQNSCACYISMAYVKQLRSLPSMALPDTLYNAISKFSIPRVITTAPPRNLGRDPQFRYPDGLQDRLHTLVNALFEFLTKTDSERHTYLLKRQQAQYDIFIRETLRGYPTGSASLVLALSAAHGNLPVGIQAFNQHFQLFHFGNSDRFLLRFGRIDSYHSEYIQFLSDFVQNAMRSQEYHAGPILYAHAAQQCLAYLCDHKGSAQRLPPRMSKIQRSRLRNTPWKWKLHRGLDVGGPRNTPWLWIRPPITVSHLECEPGPACQRRQVTSKPIYVFARRFTLEEIEHPVDPVVVHQMNFEKFYLALIYLIYFLPRAAMLPELVHLCRTSTFASRSQSFPRKSAQARACMHAYAADS